MVTFSEWLPTTTSPVTGAPPNPMPGVTQEARTAFGRLNLSNSLAARGAGQRPIEFSSARACAARHISWGSRGANSGGDGINLDWDPGECPNRGVITQFTAPASNVVGTSISYSHTPIGIPGGDSMAMTGLQSIESLTFDPDWSNTGSPVISLLSGGYITQPTPPAGATVEYRIVGLSLTMTLFRLGYEAVTDACTVAVSEYGGVWPPGDWVESPGGAALSITASGFRDLSSISSDGSSGPVPAGTWTAPGDRVSWVVSSPQMDGANMLGIPSGPSAVDANCRMTYALRFTGTYTVQHRFVYDLLPPLRQRQRDDGLNSSSVPRSASQMTSRQASTRQRAYW